MKAHFYHPSEITPGSFMPSCSRLFRDGRGEDLIAYLQSLRSADLNQHLLAEAAWRPSSGVVNETEGGVAGEALFQSYCSTCHSADGLTRQRWHGSFRVLPPDLFHGPYHHLSEVEPLTERGDRIARIVKFGLPGTDMPGHEYLSDRDIFALSSWLARNSTPSGQNQTAYNSIGERP